MTDTMADDELIDRALDVVAFLAAQVESVAIEDGATDTLVPDVASAVWAFTLDFASAVPDEWARIVELQAHERAEQGGESLGVDLALWVSGRPVHGPVVDYLSVARAAEQLAADA